MSVFSASTRLSSRLSRPSNTPPSGFLCGERLGGGMYVEGIFSIDDGKEGVFYVGGF